MLAYLDHVCPLVPTNDRDCKKQDIMIQLAKSAAATPFSGTKVHEKAAQIMKDTFTPLHNEES